VEGIGARPVEIDPVGHDRMLAGTSHLPHLVAAALCNAVAQLPDLSQFAGTGFRDATRIAAGQPEMWRDILLSNADEVGASLASLREGLGDWEAALVQADGDALMELLERARSVRERMVEPCDGCGNRLRGLAQTPGDKSMSHRAVMLAGLAEGTSSIWGFLDAADCIHTALAMVAMGVAVRGLPGKELEVDGVGLRGLRAPDGPVDMGNSGTGMRLLLGVLAGQGFEVTLTGDKSLSARPMDRIATPLGMMGATVTGRGERVLPPVTVSGGQLRGIEYHSPVASAQVKSAVLLAGLNADGPTTIVEPSRSRDHTERMLKAMGADVETDGSAVTLRPGRSLAACEMTVPGDFSSAAFLVAAGLLVPDSQVAAQGVLLNPTRTGLIEALAAMGAQSGGGDRGAARRGDRWRADPADD